MKILCETSLKVWLPTIPYGRAEDVRWGEDVWCGKGRGRGGEGELLSCSFHRLLVIIIIVFIILYHYHYYYHYHHRESILIPFHDILSLSLSLSLLFFIYISLSLLSLPLSSSIPSMFILSRHKLGGDGRVVLGWMGEERANIHHTLTISHQRNSCDVTDFEEWISLT